MLLTSSSLYFFAAVTSSPRFPQGSRAPTCVPSSHRPSPAPTHGHSFAVLPSTFSLRLADGPTPGDGTHTDSFYMGAGWCLSEGPLLTAWTTVLAETPLPAVKPQKAMTNEAPRFSGTDGRTDGRTDSRTVGLNNNPCSLRRAFCSPILMEFGLFGSPPIQNPTGIPKQRPGGGTDERRGDGRADGRTSGRTEERTELWGGGSGRSTQRHRKVT